MPIGLLLLFIIALTLLLYIQFIHIPEQRRKARTERHKAYLKRREQLLKEYEDFSDLYILVLLYKMRERFIKYSHYGIGDISK